MADEKQTVAEKVKRAPMKFQLRDGTPVSFKGIEKFFRDIIAHHNGARRFERHDIIEVDDPNKPLNPGLLRPGPKSPICAKCGLDQMGARNPYMEYAGTKQPVATILVESIARSEDDKDRLGGKNSAIAWLSAKIVETHDEHGVDLDEIRFVPITRCAWREGKMPNFKTKGGWCRYFAIEDLMRNPPKVVIPVGTPVLGLLSHKSNAEDWSGRLLTWRGWPDDWLMDKDFMLDRADPLDPAKTVKGHPLFGPAPDVRIPMVPVQNPRLVMRFQNLLLNRRWTKHLINALKTGKDGVPAPSYDRPWYNLSDNFDEIVSVLERLIKFASSYEHFIVAYDTETTGLKQWSYFKKLNAKVTTTVDEIRAEQCSEVIISPPPRIVTIMFRWTNPETGQPESIGFPWDYEGSPFDAEQRRALAALIIQVLCYGEIVGHNLTFDELFAIATIGCRETEHSPFTATGEWNPAWLALQDKINLMCDAAVWDTWHMAFTLLQQRGSLGLEVITYDYAPDLAGYEEEMTLLIGLYDELLNPAARKGGHYANCPKPFWNTHYKPYVMGDVETTYQARDALEAELDKSKVYKIPLARPERLGDFRYYTVPGRGWVYKNIVSKASRTLTKMMARGMYVDPVELERQENYYPEAVQDAKQRLRDIDPIIERWCVTKLQESEIERQKNPGDELPLWELDLENKEQLKELLFKVLKLKIQRLTKIGRQKFGETEDDWIANGMTDDERLEFAAVDKYTLNKLAADHKNLGPLQEYRKVFKLYSTYVRPMRNMMAERIDKKARVKDPNLSIDQCIHASFLLTGTRGGRLSCRDPNLQQLPNDGLVKRLFASRFGARGCIYAADLSQIELRLMAAACGDESMVNAYANDIDLHSLTASKIYKVPYETFTKQWMSKLQESGKADEAKKLDLQRRVAKTVNFLTGYGGGAFGLQNVLANNQIYMDIEECEGIIDSFFESYPALKKFLGIYKGFIEENGKAVSIFGRVRQFDEIWSEDREAISKALRAGCNHLIQSTASDMMLLCLITIEALMREANLNSLLVSTVHDSLVVDAVREELPQVHEIVNWTMNHIPEVVEIMLPGFDTSWMIVPFAGDSEVGLNYLEGNKIETDNPDWDKLLEPRKPKK